MNKSYTVAQCSNCKALSFKEGPRNCLCQSIHTNSEKPALFLEFKENIQMHFLNQLKTINLLK